MKFQLTTHQATFHAVFRFIYQLILFDGLMAHYRVNKGSQLPQVLLHAVIRLFDSKLRSTKTECGRNHVYYHVN